MYSFELTDRGKITVALFLVIPILILSIILAVLAFAADSPEEPPPEPAASENQEPIAPPGLTETQQPPDNGGFPPQYTDDYFDDPAFDDPISGDLAPEDTTIDDDDPHPDDDDDIPNYPPSDPSLNVTIGQLSFNFSPHIQTSLDRATSNLLNTFLNLPNNTPDSLIAIETPALSSDDIDPFMSVITAALGERGIGSQQITHIINPEMPSDEHFEVVMYFITRETK